jgi:SHS2 domain-containing protein
MNYTKWQIGRYGNTRFEILSNRRIAIVDTFADAQLISAAPDMYKALESWQELWDMRPLDSGADMQEILERCWEKTEKALAKAEGKEDK